MHISGVLEFDGGEMIIKSMAGKGRGVVAERAYVAGDLIERSHVIEVPPSDVAALNTTVLADYAFEWYDGALGLLTGFGSLFNHSVSRANMRLEGRRDERLMDFIASCDIRAGDELMFDYGCDMSFTPLD